MFAAQTLNFHTVVDNFDRKPFCFLERSNTSNDEMKLNGCPLQVKTLDEVLSARSKRNNFHVQFFF